MMAELDRCTTDLKSGKDKAVPWVEVKAQY
jgi:hypothetical protein